MAMEFTVSMENVTITTPAGNMPHVFINPAAAPKPNLNITRAWMGQNSTATSAQLSMAHRLQATAFPSGGTSATPSPLKPAGPISTITGGTVGAAGTSGVNYTTLGAGAKTLIIADTFNNLNGYLWVATPRELITLPAGSTTGYGIFLISTPSALTGWSSGVTYSED